MCLDKPGRVVLKLGTGVLTLGVGHLNEPRIRELCEQVLQWRKAGWEIIIVSSGAVGLGMGQLGLDQRPAEMSLLQACAAIGQTSLVETWQKAFGTHQVSIAQVLLTREDLNSRNRHIGVRDTLQELLSRGVIPVINENDTVSTEEIKFGDNDVLSALVASLVKADTLVILSTVAGLKDLSKNGALIPLVESVTPEIQELAEGTQSATAVGGMVSKLEAAKIANRSGCGVFIIDGRRPIALGEVLNGRNPGTFFVPHSADLKSRKRWLAFFQKPCGSLVVDTGARAALENNGGSLLARGILATRGDFSRGSMVEVEDDQGVVFARGFCQFSSSEVKELLGQENQFVQTSFPNIGKGEVIHRDSLVLCD